MPRTPAAVAAVVLLLCASTTALGWETTFAWEREATSGFSMLLHGPWLGLGAAAVGLCRLVYRWRDNRCRLVAKPLWGEDEGLVLGIGLFLALFTLTISVLVGP
jgi:hypothetical protein